MARKKKAYTNPSFNDFFTDGEPNELCWNYISTLSGVVVSKYFSKYLIYFDREDLVSLAISDCASFINKVRELNHSDEIKNLRNVLFTRIRNTLSNFVFRSNKLVRTEDEVLDKFYVYPKSFEIKSDLVSLYDLNIDSIDAFRSVTNRAWKIFLTDSAKQKYFINNNNNDLKDWKTYSEIRNMKTPCDLIDSFDKYTDDQIEALADKLDSVTGQNYFSTLYQLLGNKFLAFLDVFQEDKFNIPSTMLVKHLLTDMSICEDFDNGMSTEDISNKYNKSLTTINKVIAARKAI
jgi:Mor family transcriptional regulator